MQYRTRGVVLHSRNYSETSAVVKVYTELFGQQTYLLRGVHGKRSAVKIAILQPLSTVDMLVHHRETRELQRASEVIASPAFETIPFDIRKASIAIFISEVLIRSVREEESNKDLFEFLCSFIRLLDHQETHIANLHLYFLIVLSRYLGFYPHGEYGDNTSFFNLAEGKFQGTEPLHPHYLSPALSGYLDRLVKCSAGELAELQIPAEQRRELLAKLLEFYELHIPGFKGIKSHLVLEQVMG